MIKKESKPENMPRRRSLFWDTNPESIDADKNARYIIERILDFGTDDEIRWLVSYYPPEVIKDVLKSPRNTLHRKTKALWGLIFQ